MYVSSRNYPKKSGMHFSMRTSTGWNKCVGAGKNADETVTEANERAAAIEAIEAAEPMTVEAMIVEATEETVPGAATEVGAVAGTANVATVPEPKKNEKRAAGSDLITGRSKTVPT